MQGTPKVRTRIGEAAKERGWSQARLARALGLYPSNLSLMDRGRRSVSLKSLSRIAQFLDVSVSDLITVSPREENHPFPNETLNQLLLQKIRTSPRKDKRWLHATMLAWQKHFQKNEIAQ